MAENAMPLNVPRRLGQREIDLIEQLAYCQLEMTPRQFEAKWDVDRSQIAALCHCSLGNVAALNPEIERVDAIISLPRSPICVGSIERKSHTPFPLNVY